MVGGSILFRLQGRMAEATENRTTAMAVANAAASYSLIKAEKSIRDLRGQAIGQGDSAIVVAAGPSVRQTDPARQIRESGYRGAVISSESAISYLLRAGIVPDLVVSVDPHPMRIVRFLGDPHLSPEVLESDDYFRRQDLDVSFADEMRKNDEILELMARHGRDIRIALSSSASTDLVRRVHEIGMDVYWWNPLLDDPDQPESQSRRLMRSNGLPALNAGGNVGTACWMMAHAVLEKRRVALTGVDFGYYDTTPYTATQYYHEAVALVGKDRLDEIFVKIFNPHLERWFYTDPAYYWYRQAFLELAADADCETWNCTQGGILFGDNIRFTPLAEFLASASA
jgi:hypothetical protein